MRLLALLLDMVDVILLGMSMRCCTIYDASLAGSASCIYKGLDRH